MKDSFIFYKSYYDAISHLDKDMQLQAYKTIHEYAFNGIVPDENADGVSKMVFTFVKPTIDSSFEKYNKHIKNGKLGGRPRKISENYEQMVNECQTNRKTQKIKNLNDNDNYNDNDNDNDNVNVNVNDNVYDDVYDDENEKADDNESVKEKENEKSRTIHSLINKHTSDTQTRLLLKEWLDIRSAKGIPNTASAVRINLECLDDVAKSSGLDVKAYLREIIKRSWGAFYVLKDTGNEHVLSTNGLQNQNTSSGLDFNLDDIFETPEPE